MTWADEVSGKRKCSPAGQHGGRPPLAADQPDGEGPGAAAVGDRVLMSAQGQTVKDTTSLMQER
ncbi:hypothetical protein [Streptomyces sp. NEAU-YJ-81]|uniref:hypothetical protein n=1 Tax=Streptomyces sp. NEAU-YJ-81 TaxID=2820288 RepID=UPI001ABC5EA5|nr:hypothetical protein [Streptomyces sp. NEAU-YJ-81]MBO3681806.1 hypothetical protein [Streptomyces sp. NEAU-YJ-81]